LPGSWPVTSETRPSVHFVHLSSLKTSETKCCPPATQRVHTCPHISFQAPLSFSFSYYKLLASPPYAAMLSFTRHQHDLLLKADDIHPATRPPCEITRNEPPLRSPIEAPVLGSDPHSSNDSLNRIGSLLSVGLVLTWLFTRVM
jgi:hypothetical protein